MAKKKHALSVLENEALTGYLTRMKKRRNQSFWQQAKSTWWFQRLIKSSLNPDAQDLAPELMHICMVATVIMLAFFCFTIRPIFGLTLPVAVIVGMFQIVAPASAWISDWNRTRKKLKGFSVRELILEFQRKRIEDMQAETIGNETAFHNKMLEFRLKRSRLEASLQKVNTLETQHSLRFITQQESALPFVHDVSCSAEGIDAQSPLLTIVKEPASLAYLQPLKQKLMHRIKLLDQTIEKGDAFVLLVTKWADSRFQELDRLDETLKEREVIDEALQACEDTNGIVEEGDLVIAQTIAALNERIKDARNEIHRYYEESGVALAISAAETGEMFDTKILDRMIEDHVPAKLEAEKKVS